MKDIAYREAIYKSWFSGLKGRNKDTPHIIIGYGSLLSKSSREKYSNIKSLPLPLQVKGWERSWITRSQDEKQTYVGAVQNNNKWLNAQVFYTEIDESLLAREQDYRFKEVKMNSLVFDSVVNEGQLDILSRLNFYICETLEPNQSSNEFPVNSSYIDTCLKGCLEIGIEGEVSRFIKTTSNWPSKFKNNDRHETKYPRAAAVAEHEMLLFDKIERQSKNDEN